MLVRVFVSLFTCCGNEAIVFKSISTLRLLHVWTYWYETGDVKFMELLASDKSPTIMSMVEPEDQWSCKRSTDI